MNGIPQHMKFAWFLLTIIIWHLVGLQTTHAAPSEEEIETLDIVEITAMAVPEKRRDIQFPFPSRPSSGKKAHHLDLRPDGFLKRHPIARTPQFLLDQTAHVRGVATPVKPLQAEHPTYPRQAREQGWEGVVIIQVHINKQGLVESSEIHESSGHSLLDTQALLAIQHWKFQPAKNGNFSVPAIANIPIKFDLRS